LTQINVKLEEDVSTFDQEIIEKIELQNEFKELE